MNIQLRDRSRMSSNSKDRPSTATQRWSGRARAADLSVSAMADADDSVSMVGAAPRRRQAIDQFAWGRAALHFAGISVAEHEGLARKLGVGAAGEVLLLVIAQQCGANTHKRQQARDFGHSLASEALDLLDGLAARLQRRCGQSAGAGQLRRGCCPFGLIRSRRARWRRALIQERRGLAFVASADSSSAACPMRGSSAGAWASAGTWWQASLEQDSVHKTDPGWCDNADIEGGGAMAGARCPEVIEEGICRDGAKEQGDCEDNLHAEGAPLRQEDL